MYCYFSIKSFLLMMTIFCGTESPNKLNTATNIEVTYEIFNEERYPDFQYSSQVIYKKAPNVMVKVFNK